MPVDKQIIIDEIRRTATANGGTPLGKQRFFKETGIRESDWCGIHWIRWSDAVRSAGFAAVNEFQKAFAREDVLRHYAELALELGRVPILADLQMKSRSDNSFPSSKCFASHLGNKAKRLQLLKEFCSSRSGYEAVFRLCEQQIHASSRLEVQISSATEQIGFVYLMKSGRYYKIGHSNSTGRREYELGIQLPEKLTTVHTIRTDDPVGIEAYWHNRFKDKRKNGEWFDLTTADIAAFKRRKFM